MRETEYRMQALLITFERLVRYYKNMYTI